MFAGRHFVLTRSLPPLQPAVLRDVRFGVGPDMGENLRGIGRSLSGPVVASRRSHLTATRSFVSVTSRPLPPPCGRDMKLHLPNVLSAVALYTLLFPVLFFLPSLPADRLVSSSCPAFRPALLSPPFFLSFLSLSLSLQGEAG